MLNDEGDANEMTTDHHGRGAPSRRGSSHDITWRTMTNERYKIGRTKSTAAELMLQLASSEKFEIAETAFDAKVAGDRVRPRTQEVRPQQGAGAPRVAIASLRTMQNGGCSNSFADTLHQQPIASDPSLEPISSRPTVATRPMVTSHRAALARRP